MKATLEKVLIDKGAMGEMRLYRCEPGGPLPEFVAVSAIAWPGAAGGETHPSLVAAGPETYIFAADQAGNITDWMELEGSFKGAMDHEEALLGAGYEVSRG